MIAKSDTQGWCDKQNRMHYSKSIEKMMLLNHLIKVNIHSLAPLSNGVRLHAVVHAVKHSLQKPQVV